MRARRLHPIVLLAAAGTIAPLGACATQRTCHNAAPSVFSPTPVDFGTPADGPEHAVLSELVVTPGPGPSMVAGDTLAFRMLLAGSYDLHRAPQGPAYAVVPLD
jgi:hypothetical protein